MLLLRAVAGSRLYGTNRPDSDYDWFEVWDKLPYVSGRHPTRPRQTIIDGVDTIQTGMTQWLLNCEKSHQNLDAMFAPDSFCEVDLISDLRHAYRARVGTVVPAFQRVIKSFSFEDSTKKQKRHAIRLQFMINELLATGRYNPRLDPQLLEIVMTTNV